MDMYLPANRSSSKTKVFVMIHGGGWSAGDKADYSSTMDALKDHYPNHGIININYRLGTQDNPGYPKQIQDIQAALNEISKGNTTYPNNISSLEGQPVFTCPCSTPMPSTTITV